MRAAARLIRRLIADGRGGVASTFAMAVPAIAVLALGAIDLAAVGADKRSLQDVADAAALQAAKQMGISDAAGLEERTKSVVAGQLEALASRVTYSTTVDVNTETAAVTVTIDGNRASFFANMLPPGGWNFSVKARAEQMGSAPLCVLSTGAAGAEKINLANTSQILATGCLVHGNSDISVSGGSSLTAEIVQAAGLATGTINPDPQTDAPEIEDPFDAMAINAQGGLCLPTDLAAEIAPLVLLPGVHCGNITALGAVPITLLPGEHYFQKGKLELKQNSSLVGDNVVLIFGKDARFVFRDDSQIRLKGRRQGNFAGFVVMTTRDNTNDFVISSSAARELLGTVYIPNATLVVEGQDKVADQSAWTVIVAKSISLRQNPDLVINNNYSVGNTPVPTGVGSKRTAANVRLAQ